MSITGQEQAEPNEEAHESGEPVAAHDQGDSVDDRPSAVRRWQGQLLDLSLRNPLISIGESGVPLFVDEHGLAAVEDVVAEGVPVTVRGVEDLDELEVSEEARGAHDLEPDMLIEALEDGGLVFARVATRQLRTSLADLRRRAQLAHEELGASSLYLTLGGLRITTDAGAEALAPLLLLPITLTGARLGPYVIQLEPGASVRVNECLLEWLRRTCGFEPEVLRDPPVDEAGIDIRDLLARLRTALGDRDLPFEVVPDARIALLRFSTMQMWRDLGENWRTFGDNGLVRHLLEADASGYSDPVPEPETSDAAEAELSLPLPADGSQVTAVRWAAAGRTFVLEGPPGTGKSQTITNMIADALHRGRRVLFVAEKQAALDVVARRLRQVGLDGVCLDLHSKDQTTRVVRSHLRTAVERTAEGDESALDELRARRRAVIDTLADYPRARREHDDAGLDPAARAACVGEYRELGEELRQALRSEIAAGVTRRAGEPGDGDEHGREALRREVRAAGAAGLKELVEGHIDEILRITPCLLMSPSTVARLLPARAGLFDLVIFDESSQIRVSSAVGALGRARSAVIVGDSKQMPPSELFAVAGADDEAEQESILLEAHRAGVPRIRLERHYRSRTEGLVAFSNRRYYDGGLATFPTPPGASAVAGIEVRRVPGSFEQGRGGRKLNIIEGNAVVEAVREVLREHPDASVGVVTFNNSQAEYILEKLETDSSDTADAVADSLGRDDEPLFVKNLENVQGDERDYILFSLTYSAGDDGRLASSFGLLSRKGGERRLNVGLTRARRRNVFFCSFDPEQLSEAGEGPLGTEHLHDYLVAAQRGEPVDEVGSVTPDAYREAVAAALRDAGAEVVESVGLSSFRVDLAVRLGGGGWVAVALDSPEWAGRGAVVDRDELPEAVLVGDGGSGMGWADFVQVYRPEWEAEPQKVTGAILSAARSVGASERPAADGTPGLVPVALDGDTVVELPIEVARAVAAQAESVRRLAESVAGSGHASDGDAGGDHATAAVEPPTLSAFVPASEKQRGDRSVIHALPNPAAAAEVEAQWRDVVAAEGPVYADRALRIVAQRFGWRHLLLPRRNALIQCLPQDVRQMHHHGRTFLWPQGMEAEAYREVRGGSRAHRKIGEIAPQERANAIRLVLSESDGRCSEGELVRGVNEVFGFGLLGGMTRGQLRNDLAVLADRGEVRHADGEVEWLTLVTQGRITSH